MINAVTDIYVLHRTIRAATDMKILGLRLRPIARIAAFIYAFFGFVFWLSFSLSNAEYITLPVGVIAPLLHLNVNFNLHRSSSILANFLFLLGSLGTHALTGWFTAAVAVLCFNVIAKRVGGINANFILLRAQPQPIPFVRQFFVLSR